MRQMETLTNYSMSEASRKQCRKDRKQYCENVERRLRYKEETLREKPDDWIERCKEKKERPVNTRR